MNNVNKTNKTTTYEPRQRRPYTLDRTVRLIISVVLIGAAVMLVSYLSGVLLPFVIACVLAYIIHPFVKLNKQILRVHNNAFAVAVTLFQLVFIFTIIGVFLIPYIVDEVGEMASMFSRYTHSSQSIIPDTIHNYIVKYLDFDQIYKMMSQEQILSFLERTLNDLIVVMGSSLKVLFTIISWLIILLYLVFILVDYDKIISGFKSMLPPRYAGGILKVAYDIEHTMNHYFRGQALVSFIVGILFSIGFLIMGLPLAVVFGLFIGILNMVPYLQLISIPIAALLSLVLSVNTGQNFWVVFAEAITVYCVCQVIQDMVLTPRIMGKFMGLNPALIFLSLSVWGTLLGFIGFIIALPLTTLVISYYKEYIIYRAQEPAEAVDPTTDNQ